MDSTYKLLMTPTITVHQFKSTNSANLMTIINLPTPIKQRKIKHSTKIKYFPHNKEFPDQKI